MQRTLGAAGLIVTLLAGGALWAEEGAAPAEVLEKAQRLEAEVAGPAGEAAPAPLSESEAAAHDPEGAAPIDDPLTCLARSVYWEAKGEGVEAMEAVANVVMNRLTAEEFPDSICAVVKDGDESGPCQFGWWCDGKPDQAAELEQYEIALDVARRALNQELTRRTDGALFFHGAGENPSWADKFTRTTKVGNHVFYRPAEDE